MLFRSAVGVPAGYLQVGIVQVPRTPDDTGEETTTERLERQLAEAVVALRAIREEADTTLTSLGASE